MGAKKAGAKPAPAAAPAAKKAKK